MPSEQVPSFLDSVCQAGVGWGVGGRGVKLRRAVSCLWLVCVQLAPEIRLLPVCPIFESERPNPLARLICQGPGAQRELKDLSGQEVSLVGFKLTSSLLVGAFCVYID